MKLCHENNGAAIYVGRAVAVHVHTTVEYLNRNVSISQLLQHISKSIVVCAWSRQKILTKTYNHCVLLTRLKGKLATVKEIL